MEAPAIAAPFPRCARQRRVSELHAHALVCPLLSSGCRPEAGKWPANFIKPDAVMSTRLKMCKPACCEVFIVFKRLASHATLSPSTGCSMWCVSVCVHRKVSESYLDQPTLCSAYDNGISRTSVRVPASSNCVPEVQAPNCP